MLRIRLGMRIRILSKYLSRHLNNLKDIDCALSGPQALILGFICDSEGDVFQRDVEKYLNIRRSTATGLINGLEKHDYIKRVPVDYDARLKKLVPTEKSKKQFEVIEDEVFKLENKMLKGLSKEELDAFENIISKMIDNLLEESNNE